jgi:anthranilate phosphoribosyltransferase
MKQILEKLLSNISLSQEESHNIMLSIMSGEFNDAQISGFLIALRAKGESSSEIAGFAQAMRDKMTTIESVEREEMQVAPSIFLLRHLLWWLEQEFQLPNMEIVQ